MHPLVTDNLRVLEQGVELIELLDEVGYAGAGVTARVGPHVRHVLEHYRCLLAGLRGGVVDYDTRPRDPRLEQDRRLALAELRGLAAGLAALEPPELEQDLWMRSRAGALAEQDNGLVSSSPQRELHFVLLHAVHHWALLAAELRLRGLPVSPEVGTAPATLGFQQGA